MRKFITLVRREVWEHANLWRVPLVLLVLTGLVNIGFSGAARWIGLMPTDISSRLVGSTLGSLGSIVFLVFAFLVLFYLIDCLFSERQDKSILFWRSLPISDTSAVLAKLFVATVVIPVIIWLTIIAAQLMTLVFQTVSDDANSQALFSIVNLSTYWRNLLLILLLTALWTLPLLSWFLFCSSWSKRTPFLAALAIPIFFILLDFIFSLDIGLADFISARIPFGHALVDSGGEKSFLIGLSAIASNAGKPLSLPAFLVFFKQPGLWLGLLVAVALTTTTIWIRRWRDDG